MGFCYGTPGAIPLLTLASTKYPKLKYQLLETAEKAGDITWQKGLILDENSLCHGITGNGYLLHNLYRTFLEYS